jgi:hypothetical protein
VPLPPHGAGDFLDELAELALPLWTEPAESQFLHPVCDGSGQQSDYSAYLGIALRLCAESIPKTLYADLHYQAPGRKADIIGAKGYVAVSQQNRRTVRGMRQAARGEPI